MLHFVKRLLAWLRFEGWLFQTSEGWRRAGAANPVLAAMKELDLRAHLEAFRDYASAEYLAEGTLLEELKATWCKQRLKGISAGIGLREAGALRNVVRDMPPSEAFHPAAYRAWIATSARISAEARRDVSTVVGIKNHAARAQRVLRS